MRCAESMCDIAKLTHFSGLLHWNQNNLQLSKRYWSNPEKYG